MEHLQHMDWLALIVASSLVLGVVFCIVLLIAKYPAARQLGKLLFTYCLFLIPILAEGFEGWKWSVVSITSVTFYLYISTFFSQKSRINYLHLLATLLIITTFFWLKPIAFWCSILLSIYYLYLILNRFKTESAQRGFDWFY